MDWAGLIVNVAAIFIGLAIFLGIINSKWGKEHQDIQYFIMLVAVLAACVIAGVLRLLVGMVL